MSAGAEKSALVLCEGTRMFYRVLYPPYFVGWGTLALINPGLAQAKQKSGLLWFLLSLLLGPVATLILVLLPKG